MAAMDGRIVSDRNEWMADWVAGSLSDSDVACSATLSLLLVCVLKCFTIAAAAASAAVDDYVSVAYFWPSTYASRKVCNELQNLTNFTIDFLCVLLLFTVHIFLINK